MTRWFGANKQRINLMIPNKMNAYESPIFNPFSKLSFIKLINAIEIMILKSETKRLKFETNPRKIAAIVFAININKPE